VKIANGGISWRIIGGVSAGYRIENVEMLNVQS
jgi:hypothetical protein